jgi:hypothetical protein
MLGHFDYYFQAAWLVTLTIIFKQRGWSLWLLFSSSVFGDYSLEY